MFYLLCIAISLVFETRECGTLPDATSPPNTLDGAGGRGCSTSKPTARSIGPGRRFSEAASACLTLTPLLLLWFHFRRDNGWRGRSGLITDRLVEWVALWGRAGSVPSVVEARGSAAGAASSRAAEGRESARCPRPTNGRLKPANPPFTRPSSLPSSSYNTQPPQILRNVIPTSRNAAYCAPQFRQGGSPALAPPLPDPPRPARSGRFHLAPVLVCAQASAQPESVSCWRCRSERRVCGRCQAVWRARGEWGGWAGVRVLGRTAGRLDKGKLAGSVAHLEWTIAKQCLVLGCYQRRNRCRCCVWAQLRAEQGAARCA